MSIPLDLDEAFWPGTNGDHQQLYRGYKRLVNTISERLRRQEVLALVYQYDLPTWYIEVGPTYEQGHALRVLVQMESMQIFSPTNLGELAQALKDLGRADLARMISEFEEQNARSLQSFQPNAVMDEFHRSDTSRRSFDAHKNRRPWPFQSMRGRSSVDMILSSSPYQQQQTRHQLSLGSSNSREGTPFESVADFELPTFPSDGAKEKPSNPAMLSVSVTQIAADSLTQQVNQLRHSLADYNMTNNQDVSHSLVQALLAAKQVCSYLNIAYTALQSEKIRNTATILHTKSNSVGESDRYAVSPVNLPDTSPIHLKSRSVDHLETTSFCQQSQSLPYQTYPSYHQRASLPRMQLSPSPPLIPPPVPPPVPPRPRPRKTLSTPHRHLDAHNAHHSTISLDEPRSIRRSRSTENCKIFNPDMEEQWIIEWEKINDEQRDSARHTTLNHEQHNNSSFPPLHTKPVHTTNNSRNRSSMTAMYDKRLATSAVDLAGVSSNYTHLGTKKSPKEWFKRKSKEERLSFKKK